MEAVSLPPLNLPLTKPSNDTVSPGKKKRQPKTARGAPRQMLTARDMKSINDYIGFNRNISHTHRTGFLTERIPSATTSDTGEDLQLAPIPVKEPTLDRPLRLVAPAVFRAPAMQDPKGRDLKQTLTALSCMKGLPMTSLRTQGAAEIHSSSVKKSQRNGKNKGGRDSSPASKGLSRFSAPLTLADFELRALSCKRANRTKEEAIAYYNIGCLYYTMLDFTKCIEYWEKAVVLFEELGDRVGLGLVHNNIGIACYHGENVSKAVSHFKKQEVLGTMNGRATAMINQGVAHNSIADLAAACVSFESALTAAYEANDDMLQSLAQGNLGLCYLQMGKLSEARRYLEQCLELCSLAGDKPAVAVCLLLLGEVFSLLSDHHHATFYFENAMRVALETHMQDLAEIARVNLGVSRGSADYRQCVLQLATSMGKPPSIGQVLRSQETTHAQPFPGM